MAFRKFQSVEKVEPLKAEDILRDPKTEAEKFEKPKLSNIKPKS